MTVSSNNGTLSAARIELMSQRRSKEGAVCPCCDQLAKVYTRHLNSAMARFLLWMAKYSMKKGMVGEVGPWISIDKFPMIQRRRGGGDFAKLRFWSFIEQMEADANDPTKRTSGVWRITSRGMNFALQHSTASKNVQIYNNKAIDFSSERIGISEALGKKFDYSELWGSGAEA